MELREKILAADDRTFELVEVPEWDVTLGVREIGLQDALRFLSSSDLDGDKLTVRAEEVTAVIVAGLVDPETHKPVFSRDDVPELLEKSRSVLMRLYVKILGLSGSVEEAEGN